MNSGGPILLLGLGNVLCSDDGVGVAAVHALCREYELAPAVAAYDGGTLGLDLLGLVADADAVVLLDAVRTDDAPGSLVRLAGDQVPPAVYARLSPHQLGVSDLLAGAALLDRYPRRVTLLGVVPESLALGLALSPAVAARVPALVRAAVDELAALGQPATPRAARLAQAHPDPIVRSIEAQHGGER